MKHRQRGMTFLGLVVILVILGTAVYAGMRLVPVFLDYTKVARSLEQVRDEYSAVNTSAREIRNSLERRWDVEDAKGIDWKDVEITKTQDGFDMRAAYDVTAPFVANVSFLVSFDKTVSIPQG
jgi:type II secretory pathway pseudopilin PulG